MNADDRKARRPGFERVVERVRWRRWRQQGWPGIAVRAALLLIPALVVCSMAHAGEGKWSLRLEALSMEAFGHDQHVLTIHEIDFDAMPQVQNSTAVKLETDSGLAYRGEFRHTGQRWGWGVDFFWFNTSQKATDRTASADGSSGAGDQIVFEIAGRHYSSSEPGEVLYYRVLEDTDLAVWTLDLYGMRTLAAGSASGIHLLFGLRTADFDNDYRAVVGLENTVGTRVDASSNYDRMMGPLIALAGDVDLGRSSIRGYLGQSVLLGSVELISVNREFTGPFGELPFFVDQRMFRAEQDVAIPITEFRLDWSCRISRHFALGLGINTAAWWDVPVPPGAIPAEDGIETLHENTIVFVGVVGAVVLTF
jgi:hypothetical protein